MVRSLFNLMDFIWFILELNRNSINSLGIFIFDSINLGECSSFWNLHSLTRSRCYIQLIFKYKSRNVREMNWKMICVEKKIAFERSECLWKSFAPDGRV